MLNGKKICYSIYSIWIDIIYGCITWIIIGGVAYGFRNKPELNFLLYAFILIASYGFLAFVKSRERKFFFCSFDGPKEGFDWIGNGKFKYSKADNCFLLGDCDPGYLYTKCFTWTNYELDFDFKLMNKCIGCIIRAVNLSDYVMLQIARSGIRPHIRINGAWRVWEAKDEGVSLDFHEPLDLDSWYQCRIICENDVVTIKIAKGKEAVFDRLWRLPTGYVLFPFKKSNLDSNPVEIPFSINFEYGTVGFRNSGDESALIKNLLIKKI